jgi:stage II sporulation protein GA (sporulation sigma-E factor processing peptidase)
MSNLKTIIYIDILIALNLFVNYFLLLAVAKFLYLKPRRKRLVLGACLGAIYSVYIFLPEINSFLSLLIKSAMALSIVCVTFGILKELILKTFLCFLIINFAFLGLTFAMWIIFRPAGMIIKNGIIYFNFSPLTLVISTIISYFIIELINKIIGHHSCENMIFKVKIVLAKKCAIFDAYLDTGNNLKEPFSHLPVILVNKTCIKNILPKGINFEDANKIEEYSLKFNKKLRLIPFGTISGEGNLIAFKPDLITIQAQKGNAIRREAYIAICEKVNNAIIGVDIIN